MSTADDLQRLAADPQSCVWVAASAGTGKTKVLTDRVLNLLLDGATPARILCLTFTRAAAGEMQIRLNKRLSQWVTLDETNLRARLQDLLGRVPSDDQVQRARSLFPLVLDCPGGMKIQTIHAFCQSILKRFPLEANLSPHFTVMDETDADHLLQQIQNDVLRSNSDVKPWLHLLTDIFDDLSFSDLLSNLMAERTKWSWVVHQEDGLQDAQEQLEKQLGVALSDTEEGIISQFCQHSPIQALESAGQALVTGSKTDQSKAEIILKFAKAQQKKDLFEAYAKAFLTTTGEIRKKLVTKKLAEDYPTLEGLMQREADRVLEAVQRLKALNCAKRSWAILQLGREILRHYDLEKSRRGVLDYGDLIEKTAQLLRRPDIAPWVLYKLDGGLDHMLVDEAQDTNLQQWTVVSALAEEFFSGDGASAHNRTLFVVGDAKQSIYSFQGANPYVFDDMRTYFTRAVEMAKRNWREVKLSVSFRSTQAVLDTVDKVFEDLTARQGVAIQNELIEHKSFRKGQGGLVEVWPLARANVEKDEAVWEAPTKAEGVDVAPQVRLARVMAARIKSWLDSGEFLVSQGRPIQAGDIMVLVRRRSGFVDALVQALKAAKVPVAGSDRLNLMDHIAVKDLIALGQFVLQPLDDLNLACVLKGPLVGASEDDLFRLAYNRGEDSLWQRVQGEQGREYEVLQDLMDLARTSTPLDFYTSVLTTRGGRKALLSRLGYEALDPIEEFLNRVEHYQKSNTSSLLGFLQWLAQGDVEVKRDLDVASQNEVRIMTVHGSKGLQAPIVFLPDTTQMPKSTDRVLWAGSDEQHQLPVWSPPAGQNCEASSLLKENAQAHMEQEYRRLLYVALTRAEDRLYVCGWEPQNEVSPTSWYQLVHDSVGQIGSAVDFDFTQISKDGWAGKGAQYACPQVVEVAAADAVSAPDASPQAPPSWLNEVPDLSEVTAPPVRPSTGGFALPDKVYDRGRILHTLLQYLPDVDADHRHMAGLQVMKTMPHVPGDEAAEMVAHVERVLGDEKLKQWFGPNSRAEVPITAQINGKQVSGQIDRLFIVDREIVIIDYKTSVKPATNIDEVPTVYLHQLMTYKEVLQRIYPRHNIRTILIWTQNLTVTDVTKYLPSIDQQP